MIRARIDEDGHYFAEVWTSDAEHHVAQIHIEDSGDASNRVIYVHLERIEGQEPEFRVIV